MTLPRILALAHKRTGAPQDELRRLSGRFQACGPDSPEERGMFNEGHAEMLMFWWERGER